MTREVAERLYEALASGDRDVLAEVLHPEFEGHTAVGMPLGLGGVYRGPDAMRTDFWGVVARHYRARAVANDFDTLEDGSLLVTGHYVGEGKVSGKTLDAGFTHKIVIVDGRIRRLDQLTDT
jgi:2-(1,2-epoxy-1,2-dihydrophenyl)acetyl-CoA isomerase